MPYDKTGGRFHPDFLRNGSPSTILRESFPRWAWAKEVAAELKRVGS